MILRSSALQNVRTLDGKVVASKDSVVLGSFLPPDVEGAAWQDSTLQSTLAFSFTVPLLPYWLHLWFYSVFGKIFYSCHRGEGNKM